MQQIILLILTNRVSFEKCFSYSSIYILKLINDFVITVYTYEYIVDVWSYRIVTKDYHLCWSKWEVFNIVRLLCFCSWYSGNARACACVYCSLCWMLSSHPSRRVWMMNVFRFFVILSRFISVPCFRNTNNLYQKNEWSASVMGVVAHVCLWSEVLGVKPLFNYISKVMCCVL